MLVHADAQVILSVTKFTWYNDISQDLLVLLEHIDVGHIERTQNCLVFMLLNRIPIQLWSVPYRPGKTFV
jgi:hypothetical protein